MLGCEEPLSPGQIRGDEVEVPQRCRPRLRKGGNLETEWGRYWRVQHGEEGEGQELGKVRLAGQVQVGWGHGQIGCPHA